MPKKFPARRRKVSPIAAAVLTPIVKRLARMEALLFEMRHEQDVKLKKINAIRSQIESLTEHVTANGAKIQLLVRRPG
jgi:hypothetical protein